MSYDMFIFWSRYILIEQISSKNFRVPNKNPRLFEFLKNYCHFFRQTVAWQGKSGKGSGTKRPSLTQRRSVANIYYSPLDAHVPPSSSHARCFAWNKAPLKPKRFPASFKKGPKHLLNGLFKNIFLKESILTVCQTLTILPFLIMARALYQVKTLQYRINTHAFWVLEKLLSFVPPNCGLPRAVGKR